MNADVFASRLRAGKASSLLYARDGKEGLVSVWMHASSIILTWEECPKGQQYNESSYTRDNRYVFDTYEELMAFLSQQGLALEAFRP